jgi:hypothetical protein
VGVRHVVASWVVACSYVLDLAPGRLLRRQYPDADPLTAGNADIRTLAGAADSRPRSTLGRLERRRRRAPEDRRRARRRHHLFGARAGGDHRLRQWRDLDLRRSLSSGKRNATRGTPIAAGSLR